MSWPVEGGVGEKWRVCSCTLQFPVRTLDFPLSHSVFALLTRRARALSRTATTLVSDLLVGSQVHSRQWEVGVTGQRVRGGGGGESPRVS